MVSKDTAGVPASFVLSSVPASFVLSIFIFPHLPRQRVRAPLRGQIIEPSNHGIIPHALHYVDIAYPPAGCPVCHTYKYQNRSPKQSQGL